MERKHTRPRHHQYTRTCRHTPSMLKCRFVSLSSLHSDDSHGHIQHPHACSELENLDRCQNAFAKTIFFPLNKEKHKKKLFCIIRQGETSLFGAIDERNIDAEVYYNKKNVGKAEIVYNTRVSSFILCYTESTVNISAARKLIYRKIKRKYFIR